MRKFLDDIETELQNHKKKNLFLFEQIVKIIKILQRSSQLDGLYKIAKDSKFVEDISISKISFSDLMTSEEYIKNTVKFRETVGRFVVFLVKEHFVTDTSENTIFDNSLANFKSILKNTSDEITCEIARNMISWAGADTHKRDNLLYVRSSLSVLRRELLDILSFNPDKYDEYKSIESTINNEYYCFYSKEIFIPTLVALLDQYKSGFVNIEYLMNYSGDARSEIAWHTSDSDVSNMGRKPVILSDNGSFIYKELLRDPISINPQWIGWKNKVIEMIQNQYKNPQDGYKIEAVSDQEVIGSLKWLMLECVNSHDNVERNIHKKADTIFYNTHNKSVVYVYNADDIEKVLYCVHQPATPLGISEIDKFVRIIVNDDNIGKKKLTKCIAQILWYLHHGTYYARGQASVGENLAKALAKFSGWELNFPDKSSKKGKNMNYDHHILIHLDLNDKYLNYCANYFELTKIDKS